MILLSDEYLILLRNAIREAYRKIYAYEEESERIYNSWRTVDLSRYFILANDSDTEENLDRYHEYERMLSCEIPECFYDHQEKYENVMNQLLQKTKQ